MCFGAGGWTTQSYEDPSNAIFKMKAGNYFFVKGNGVSHLHDS